MAGAAKATTNHDEIRQWADDRNGHPACVKGTKGKGPGCLLRIDFPGYSGAESLERMEWDDFFDIFDANKLAFLHQDTIDGETSRFNKIVSRESVDTDNH